MVAAQTIGTFRLQVRPSPETNDHEVRFLVDGVDLIDRHWPDMIGVDPDDLLQAPSPLAAGQALHAVTVARCGCGLAGCGSTAVTIEPVGEHVVWHWQKRTLRIPARAYAAELARAVSDTSWEPPDRTAARLVRTRVDRACLAAAGLAFDWASGRVAAGRLTASLALGSEQILVHVTWPFAVDAAAIAEQLVEHLARPPCEWTDVEMWTQTLPELAGPGWRARRP